MKKIFSLIGFSLFAIGVCTGSADAYQLLSSKELGRNDAKNQTIVVKCTTDMGKVSNETCTLRRYTKCSGTGTNQKCSGWQEWTDLRNPGIKYSDWRPAAATCCQAKGLR